MNNRCAKHQKKKIWVIQNKYAQNIKNTQKVQLKYKMASQLGLLSSSNVFLIVLYFYKPICDILNNI